MSDSVTPWTAARQAPLSMGILQARILGWVAMASSRGFCQPRDRTQVSCIVGRFFTSWATREACEGTWRMGPISRESTCIAGEPGLIPGSGRSPGDGKGYPLPHSCLENSHGQRSLAGYCPWDHRVRHDCATKHNTAFMIYLRKICVIGILMFFHPCIHSSTI